MVQPGENLKSIPEAVEQVYQSGFRLNINRLDVSFLAGLHTLQEVQQSFSLTFSDLEKVYGIVADLAENSSDLTTQRTQNAIEKLVKNQLLLRVDGGGISSSASFDISGLGKSIISYISSNDRLTRQNLTIITSRIISHLGEIRRALAHSGSEQFWNDSVLLPLRHVIAELLEAIEKRQRGLDREQEDIRTQISDLLEKNWMEALTSCENLLEATSSTLQELYRTLLTENATIKQGLNDIYEQADKHSKISVIDAIDNIYLRLDQIENWGKDRVGSWSQYYRRVNDFLQSMVRFDPHRELSQKLKEQIQTYPDDPWFEQLVVPPVYRTIRDVQYEQAKQKVVRELPARDRDELFQDDDGNLVLDLMIDSIKEELASENKLNLIEILKPYLEKYSLDKVYPHIGTLVDLIVKEIKQRPVIPSQWERPIDEIQFEIQNLILDQPQNKD